MMKIKKRKLKGSIKKITTKGKDLNIDLKSLSVFGVSKESGVVVTGKEVGKDLSKYYYFEGQKFAYNPYRANIGSIGLTTTDFKGLISPAYVVFEVDDSIIPEFLLAYFKSPFGQNEIRKHGNRGGVRSSLRFNDLEKIIFPDLTIKEQKDFVIKYREHSHLSHKLLNEFITQKNLLDSLRLSTFQDAIEGKLTQSWRKKNVTDNIHDKAIEDSNLSLPQNWIWKHLGEITKIQNGYAFKSRNFTSNGIKLLRNINIGIGNLNWDNTVYYPQNLLKGLGRFKLEENDIVISLDRPIIKGGLKIAQIKKNDLPAMLLQRVGRISPNDTKSKIDYLLIWFKSNHFIKNLKQGRSSGVPHISTKDIEKQLLPIPPLKEQVEIVNVVKSTLVQITEKQNEVESNIKRISDLELKFFSDYFGDLSTIVESFNSKENNSIEESRVSKFDSNTILMDLIELLQKHGKLHAEDLWKMSKYPKDIDAFYAELKHQIEDEKSIKEVENEKGYLELA